MVTLTVGAALRQERLRQGLSIGQIANQTRISQRFLEAIEAENFDQLPGVIFTRNFVRQFAAALGLDAAPLLAGLPKIDIESVPLPDAAQFARPRMHSRRWVSVVSWLAWLTVATGASVGGYAYLNHRQSSPSVPQAQTAPVLKSAPVQTQAVQTQVPEPQVAEAKTVATTPQELAPPDSASPVQVVLTARESSWVQIVADGKNAFTGILQAHDSRSVAAQASVKLTAGNAGGLEISLNGKSLDPLGPSGQVRTVRLTADGPQMVVRNTQPL